jgi:TLC domain
MFFLNMLERQCIAFTAVVLIVEVNTVFLHTRKMLQMCKVPFSSWMYRTNAVANIATFVSCRFGCISYVILSIVAFGDVLGTRYIVVVSVATFVMGVINIVLFWRLICSDFVRGHRSRASSRKKSAHIKESPDEVLSSGVDACADYASTGFALRKRDTSSSSHCQPFAAAYDGLEIECSLIAQNILSSFGGNSCADDGLASKMQLDINGIAG